MEEIAQGKVWGKGMKRPCSPSVLTALPKSPCAHQPGSSLNPILSVFHKGFITEVWLIKPSAMDSSSSPSLLPGGKRGGNESSNPLTT